jgi:ATP-binding cassette subfamily B (MDR/TAP) protein 1
MFFTLALTNLVSYAVLWFLFAVAGATISRNYRAEYLRDILGEDMSFFEVKGNSPGALASLLSSDGDDLEMMFSMSLALIMVFFIDIFSCGILAIAISWRLGLVGVLACYPALFLAGYFRISMDRTAQDRCASSFLESARFSSEAIGAIRTISSLSLESKVIERYEYRLRKAFITSTRRMFVSNLFFALSDCVDFLGTL